MYGESLALNAPSNFLPVLHFPRAWASSVPCRDEASFVIFTVCCLLVTHLRGHHSFKDNFPQLQEGAVPPEQAHRPARLSVRHSAGCVCWPV